MRFLPRMVSVKDKNLGLVILKKMTRSVDFGSLTVNLPDGSVFLMEGSSDGPKADITLHDHTVLPRLAQYGSVGFGGSYIDGSWSTSNLYILCQFGLLNFRMESKFTLSGLYFYRMFLRISQMMRRNTRSGSEKNIRYHYDLGNDFYRMWLDPSMSYSAALFHDHNGAPSSVEHNLQACSYYDASSFNRDGVSSLHNAQHNFQHNPVLANGNEGTLLLNEPSQKEVFAADLDPSMKVLEQAQVNKYQRIIDVIHDVTKKQPQKILEIGCGWGGFLAQGIKHGHQLTGITISKAQEQFVKSRLRETGGHGDAQVVLKDYRDVDERFDAVVSIEMFEALGKEYWPVYFSQISRCLKDRGVVVIQLITRQTKNLERYLKSPDFIRHYIFPGGALINTERFEQEATKAGLQLVDSFQFGHHYARTLRIWHQRVLQKNADIRALGFDSSFLRGWCFYLESCAAGFSTGHTDVVQFTLRKN